MVEYQIDDIFFAARGTILMRLARFVVTTAVMVFCELSCVHVLIQLADEAS